MTRAATWTIVALAALFGIAYALLTPPFEVPDEIFHFWRPMVLAQGQLMPVRRHEPDAAMVPVGVKTLVYVMSLRAADGKYTRAQIRDAAAVPLEATNRKPIRFMASYTPVPYIPQTLVAVAARLFDLRPLVAFYLGRVANLLAALALLAAAMRIAPAAAAPMAAVLLLPATLHELASWSADPLTIAFALLLTAMLVAGRVSAATVATAFLLALCKPAYFLIALLVLATAAHAAMKATVIAASGLGTALAMAYNSLAAYNQRIGVPIDGHAQLVCILRNPLGFAAIVARDLADHGWTYLAQMTARFGATNEVAPASWVVWLELALLVAAALCGTAALRRPFRAGAAAVVIVTLGAILLATFLYNSVACGTAIEGVQGRYILPLLPLAMMAVTLPRTRWRIGAAPIIAVAILGNGAALYGVVRHFW